MKDSFIFYRSFYESIKNLDKDTQLEIYNAICEYSLNDEQLELSPVATAIFTLIKPNIDNATKRYNASVENGKKGGRPKKNENLKKPNNNLDITKDKPNQNLNVYVDVYEDVDDNVDVDKDEDINIEDIKKANIISSRPKDEEILKTEFNELWKLYPKKVGKDKAFTKYKKFRTSKGDEYCTYDEVLKGLNRYLKYIEQNSWYSPADGSTWFNNKRWKDELEIKETPSWLDKEIESEEATPEEIEDLRNYINQRLNKQG